jgi:epoxyqueuosine reductase
VAKEYLLRLLEPEGYHLEGAPWLPLKRLAVQSGLALYGRNNITYVEGMGSFFGLAAYYSDLACPAGEWHDVRQMDACAGCAICVDNCPTGAILPERFLIDNERCLSYLNEVPGEFPAWLSPSAHHCLYDCLRCQEICPQNAGYVDHVIGPIEFDERETDLLLASAPLAELPDDLKERVVLLGLDEWWGAIPRNLRVLFAQR